MKRKLIAAMATTTALTGWICISHAETIPVPNASFESPAIFYVNPNIDSWAKTSKPDWYVEEGGFFWSYNVGGFKNTIVGSSNHIDNCDGNQAIWLFAVPEVTTFQDYDSMDWNDTEPGHAFNATYDVGKSYRMTVGVIGTGGGMQEGVTLELSLYYRDAGSNRIPVAVTTLTNTPSVFSNNTHLIDCSVNVPTVKPGDAWAGRHIGIQFMSTVSSNMQGGYWDLDNVRLTSSLAPVLVNPVSTNGQFRFTLLSDPGLAFEILSSTNITTAPAAWTSLTTITNATGTNDFIDPSAGSSSRFYQARQLP